MLCISVPSTLSRPWRLAPMRQVGSVHHPIRWASVQCCYELADQKQTCGERECVVGFGRAVARSEWEEPLGGRVLLTVLDT